MSGTPVSPPHPPSCANCGAMLAGDWCQACGQKRIRREDRRFGHIVGQFVEAMTSLDSRFWLSLRMLMLAPGQLSRDYLAGRRQRYMAPVTLFVLANVLYFLAPAITDLELPFREQVHGRVIADLVAESRELAPGEREQIGDRVGQMHSPWTESWVRSRVARRDAQARAEGRVGYGFSDLQRDYDRRRGDVSRLLVILHVPALALFLWLLHPRHGLYYAEHVVVALHLFAFLLFLLELVVLPVSWLSAAFGVTTMPRWFAPASMAVVLAYYVRALQVAYAQPLWKALPRAVLLFLLLWVFSVVVYRALQFALIMALV
jgi:hypothetical protein